MIRDTIHEKVPNRVCYKCYKETPFIIILGVKCLLRWLHIFSTHWTNSGVHHLSLHFETCALGFQGRSWWSVWRRRIPIQIQGTIPILLLCKFYNTKNIVRYHCSDDVRVLYIPVSSMKRKKKEINVGEWDKSYKLSRLVSPRSNGTSRVYLPGGPWLTQLRSLRPV